MSFGNLFLWRVTLGVLFGLFAVYLPFAGLTQSESAMTTVTFRIILAGLTLLCVIAALAGPLWKRSGPSMDERMAQPASTLSESDIDSIISRYASHQVGQPQVSARTTGTGSVRTDARPPGTERRTGFGRRHTDQ